MPTLDEIPNLESTTAAALSAGDLHVVYDASSGRCKKISQTQMETAFGAASTGVIVTAEDGTEIAFAPTADTDAARGVALADAHAAALIAATGGLAVTIDLYPAPFYIGKSTSSIGGITAQFAILDKMTIRLNGARLYKKSTDTASAMFACNAANGINDWTIQGPGTLEGSFAATADTAARGASAAEIGIEVRACRRARVVNVAIKNFAGSGIEANTATFASDDYGLAKVSTFSAVLCNIDLNNKGISILPQNEYHSYVACTFNFNVTGVENYAGNTKFSNCEISTNTNGLLLLNGNNDGHGSFVGGHITHNTDYNVYTEPSMDNGFMISSSTIVGNSVSAGKIEAAGGGLTITGCYVEAPFFAGSTPTGINTMKCCFVIPAITVINAGVSAAERAQWKFINNHTPTGVWNSDDIKASFADDTAAGVGGRLTGELYQVTGGAVMVKQ